MDHRSEPEPSVVQIAGADPAAMAEAARVNAERGAQVIDINLGCPAKKVCNRLAGSALLRDEPLVRRILTAVVSAVEVPVTVKMRTGWDASHRNGVRIAQVAEQVGVAAVAVHGRTREDRFTGSAEFDTVSEIKQRISIPVIANGDIRTPEQAKAVLDYTGCDGVMIGRAAQGRPWIFRQNQLFSWPRATHLPAPEPTMVGQILLRHLESLHHFYGPAHGVRVARKNTSSGIARATRAAPTSGTRSAASRRRRLRFCKSPTVTFAGLGDAPGRLLAA